MSDHSYEILDLLAKYDVANITVISNKNTVGVYDMESEVEAVLKPAGAVNTETGNA